VICAAANPAVDTLFEVDSLRPGAIHRPRTLVPVPGGKGLNVARAARALGASPLVVALVAERGMGWIARELGDSGIELDAVARPGELRRCLSVLDAATGELTEFYERGDEVDAGAWDAFDRAVRARCRESEWLALCGSLPPGAPWSGYAELAGHAAGVGTLCAIDAEGDALREALRGGPDLVKVNLAEAAAVVPGAPDAAHAARALHELAGAGERVAIVTQGAAGAVLAGPDGLLVEGSLDARGSYSVGSGDAFLAGLLVAREAGLNWPAALARALAAGAANAELPGAGRLERRRVEALEGRASVRDLRS
jgi:1-phosphofructokinase family hexose kinase